MSGVSKQAGARLVARAAREVHAVQARRDREIAADAGVHVVEYLLRALDFAAAGDVERVAVVVRARRACSEHGRIHGEIVEVDAVPYGFDRRHDDVDVVAAAGHEAVGITGCAGDRLERQRVGDRDRVAVGRAGGAGGISAVGGVAERGAGSRGSQRDVLHAGVCARRAGRTPGRRLVA